MTCVVFTIGHSTHPIERFINLLKLHGITALCDVRSRPYSRINPQFNREELTEALREAGVTYVFLGRELGARSEDASCYSNGKVQLDLLARTDLFQKGLERVRVGMERYRLALMCADKDPIECHRTILIARHLASPEISVEHILEEGNLERHGEALSRLLRQLHLPEQDLFRTREDMIHEAYKLQSERIAYAEKGDLRQEPKPIGRVFE